MEMLAIRLYNEDKLVLVQFLILNTLNI